MVKVGEVAPVNAEVLELLILVQVPLMSFCHWYVNVPVPVAATLKEAGGAGVDRHAGRLRGDGRRGATELTVSVTVLLIALPPALVTTTQ